CSGPALQGDSGGPVFDRQGKLTAVLWGSTESETYATCCLRVRAFLNDVLGRRNRGPEVASGAPPSISPGQPYDPAAAKRNDGLKQQLDQLQQKLAATQQHTSELARQLQDALQSRRSPQVSGGSGPIP